MGGRSQENFILENGRITDGFDVFFWIFDDKSTFDATHWHTAIEIMYVLGGEIDITSNHQTVTLKAGDIYLVDTKTAHSTKSINGNQAVLLQIPYPFLKKFIPDIDNYSFHFDCHTDNPVLKTKLLKLKELLHQMQVVYEVNPKGGLLRFNSLLFELLFLLYHSFAKPLTDIQVKQHIKNFQRLEPVLQYTNDHYSQPIALSEITELIGLTEAEFHSFFEENMGISYSRYVDELRLSHIYHDLTGTDYDVEVLAAIYGFSDMEAFRSLFSQEFCMTPEEYRKKKFSE